MTPESSLIVRNTTPADIHAILALFDAVYPDIPPYTAVQLASQIRVFPEGQFVAVARGGEVVGMTGSLLVDGERTNPWAAWNVVTANGTIASHDPCGDTLYGFETMIRSDWRRRSTGSALLRARVTQARHCGARWFRGAARLAGYAAHSRLLSAREYLDRVLLGEMTDPVVCWALKNGFAVRGLIPAYLEHDPDSLGWAALVELPIEPALQVPPGHLTTTWIS